MAVFLTLAVIYMMSYFFLNRQKDQLYKQSVQLGMLALNQYAQQARLPLLEDDDLPLNMVIKDATQIEGLALAYIVDNTGTIRAHTELDRLHTPATVWRSHERERHEGKTDYFNTISETGDPLLVLRRAIWFRERLLGQIYIGLSLDHIHDVVRREQLSILLMILPVLVIGVLVAISLGLWFSRPISQLARATAEIGKGNYLYRIKLKRKDELGHLAKAFNQMNAELLRKDLIQKRFGKYVGLEVAELIAKQPEKDWLKGNRCEATIIFTDIRGFTRQAESREPEELVEHLNVYLEIAADVISAHGGYVDKFIGDAVLGVFGVPVPHDNHADQALKAALEMQRRFQRSGQSGNGFLDAVGISIHTGVVVSGNIGSRQRLESTVIGDSVNVAARLNGVAGPGEVVITQACYEKIRQTVKVERLPPQMIKGRVSPIHAYRIPKRDAEG
ncbi:MAG: HAMP domain-containing protein [Desulfosarcina sp.]|nr:HAMP domain-containing protein [Desulfobacterales bacterium]